MADFLVKQGHEIAGSSLVTPSSKADKTDLTDIIQTGTTASQAISAGTYFYLNDTLVRAKVDIANGATFTLNTNYEVVTAGALNEFKEAFEGGYEFAVSHPNFAVQKQYVTKIKDRLHIFITAIVSTSDIAASSVLGRIKHNGQNVSFASASYAVAPEYLMSAASNVVMLSTAGEIQNIGTAMQATGWITILMDAQLS